MIQLPQHIKHLVLDMDGTIYLGNTLFEGIVDWLDRAKTCNIGITFLTNNNSLSRSQYVEKLSAFGIDITPRQMLLSTDGAILCLQQQYESCKRLFVLGTEGLRHDLQHAGFECCDEHPDAVVVGFDTGLNYPRVSAAAWWISQGLPFLATHPDRICPTNQQTILPDCGAICSLLESATGRAPDVICGKPNTLMIQSLLADQNLQPHEVAMIGDRIYTDMKMASAAGICSILVLSGETTAEQAAACSYLDCVLDCVTDLALLPAKNETE